MQPNGYYLINNSPYMLKLSLNERKEPLFGGVLGYLPNYFQKIPRNSLNISLLNACKALFAGLYTINKGFCEFKHLNLRLPLQILMKI